ncbi:MAG: mannose-1-phosphate guanylyltransferase [Planctomycetota bacterium]|jgi:mannose-1-phosphate guanylyltransferase
MVEKYCVIMAGGSGQRFWPASRKSLPKQLLSIEPDVTLVQATLARVPKEIGPDRTLIVTNASQVEALRSQVQLPAKNIIAEPVGRDTAPCIGLAAKVIAHRHPGAIMAVMAADHVISPTSAFQADMVRAMDFAAENNAIVTLGIKPTEAATGYGYIQLGDETEPSLHEVKAFQEKPDQKTAERFLEDGGYLWNSGIFIWPSARILKEIEAHLPRLAAGLESMAPHIDTEEFASCLAETFPTLEKTSIDKGVVEHAKNRFCLKVSFEWDDVGSLAALARHNKQDQQGNTKLGSVVALNAKNCIADNRGDGVLALLGVEDLIVVRTGDAVLVAKRGQEEHVKDLVKKLEADGLSEFL